MDKMENTGFDNFIDSEEEKAVEVEKPKRRPFAVWHVDGTDYKLRLTGQVIAKLEGDYKRNLLSVLTDDLPPVTVMLSVIQAAMQQYHHGIKFRAVQDLYDKYIDEGGDQTALYTGVIMDLLAVSGFFTPSQEQTVKDEMATLE